MTVREVTLDDRAAIREVARQSMYASYSMSPDTIDGAVAEWYGDETLRDALDDPNRLLIVAEEDSAVVGFTDAVLHGEGEAGDLLWLHVHPDFRGQGFSRDLLDETRAALVKRGASHLRGLVLADNSEGNSFYQHFGFEKVGERHIKINGKRFVENVYQEERSAGLAMVAADDGETVYVDENDAERGSMAPFYVVYADPAKTERWAYYCSSCEGVATAMDAMERIECSTCGNTRKPTRWDAAYL